MKMEVSFTNTGSVPMAVPSSPLPWNWVAASVRQRDNTYKKLTQIENIEGLGGSIVVRELLPGAKQTFGVTLSRVAPGLRAGKHNLIIDCNLWVSTPTTTWTAHRLTCALNLMVERSHGEELKKTAHELREQILDPKGGPKDLLLEQFFSMGAPAAKSEWQAVLAASINHRWVHLSEVLFALRVVASKQTIALLGDYWNVSDRPGTPWAQYFLRDLYQGDDEEVSKLAAKIILAKDKFLPPRKPLFKAFDG